MPLDRPRLRLIKGGATKPAEWLSPPSTVLGRAVPAKAVVTRTGICSMDGLRPFAPRAIYYADADALEYVRVDQPVLYRRIDEFLTLILALDSRDPVGFKIKGFRNLYLRKLQPTFPPSDVNFLRMVTVFERILTDFGDSVFLEGTRREAYKVATNIAMEDQVIVSDFPVAA